MRRDLTLADVDRDDALTEVVAALHGDTRAELLRKAALGGATMLAALAAPAAEAEAKVTDVDILNFGLNFERLQASFYTEAERLGTIRRMPGSKARWARVLGAHERAHVAILRRVLGRKAGRRPFFDFGEANESDEGFTRTAVAMEDLTVALLSGAIPRVQDRNLTAAFLGLLTTEARHAAWARNIVGATPAAQAFDEPRSLGDVQRLIDRTRFVVARPRLTRRRRRPRFTG